MRTCRIVNPTRSWFLCRCASPHCALRGWGLGLGLPLASVLASHVRAHCCGVGPHTGPSIYCAATAAANPTANPTATNAATYDGATAAAAATVAAAAVAATAEAASYVCTAASRGYVMTMDIWGGGDFFLQPTVSSVLCFWEFCSGGGGCSRRSWLATLVAPAALWSAGQQRCGVCIATGRCGIRACCGASAR